MAPDRGTSNPWPALTTSPAQPGTSSRPSTSDEGERDALLSDPNGAEPSEGFLAARSEQRQFTPRALVLGLFIGVLIAHSNTYFGLQTGWISGMVMPSALMGFAYFKGLRTLMDRLGGIGERLGWGEGFTEVENVLVQTVAGSVGTMPLGCGFVGVIPALEFLLKAEETPPSPDVPTLNAPAGLHLSLGTLVLWALGVCFFGVVFAVPLRKEVIVREKLRFPSGTATALMIGVLHGGEKTGAEGDIEKYEQRRRKKLANGRQDAEALDGTADEGMRLMGERRRGSGAGFEGQDQADAHNTDDKTTKDWKQQIRLLISSFGGSGFYTLLSYFAPQLHALPIFGTYLSNVWLWNLNPSPAYVGQGIIMGPATTVHMLIGAILGWGVLSPLAKYRGWASGDVDDWETGGKGWIVWVSLAIMLADAIVSLGWLLLRPAIYYARLYSPDVKSRSDLWRPGNWIPAILHPSQGAYSQLDSSQPSTDTTESFATLKRSTSVFDHPGDQDQYDAPPEHRIGVKTTLIGMVLTLGFCIVATQVAFASIIPISLTMLALLLALLFSIMGVRAMGETDLNPVSGISKLTQLIFAFITPASSPNAVIINLIAGAISESGALQAGDLLQDLKTGHLLGASPKAQFWGQIVGSAVGAVVSAAVYKLYTQVYTIPGGLFQVPTGYVWIFTARLVTGRGLPPQAATFAFVAAAVWSLLTILRIYGMNVRNADGSKGAPWLDLIPGGIAVAVGMYNMPSFTLTRTAGGLLMWWWRKRHRNGETEMIILASGLILGEGLMSIVNLGLASGGVAHL